MRYRDLVVFALVAFVAASTQPRSGFLIAITVTALVGAGLVLAPLGAMALVRLMPAVVIVLLMLAGRVRI
jgi:hypothetical protein